MTIDIPEADLARWIEDVLITLMGITNTQGLKVHLSTDAQIKVLGGAITALGDLTINLSGSQLNNAGTLYSGGNLALNSTGASLAIVNTGTEAVAGPPAST